MVEHRRGDKRVNPIALLDLVRDGSFVQVDLLSPELKERFPLDEAAGGSFELPSENKGAPLLLSLPFSVTDPMHYFAITV